MELGHFCFIESSVDLIVIAAVIVSSTEMSDSLTKQLYQLLMIHLEMSHILHN